MFSLPQPFRFVCFPRFPPHSSRSQAGFSYLNLFPGLRTGFLARLGGGFFPPCFSSLPFGFLFTPFRFPYSRFFLTRSRKLQANPLHKFGVIGRERPTAGPATTLHPVRHIRPTLCQCYPNSFPGPRSFYCGESSEPSAGLGIRDFKGNFQGNYFDSPLPPRNIFPNTRKCVNHEAFISSCILDRVKNGSLLVHGKVGSVDPHI